MSDQLPILPADSNGDIIEAEATVRPRIRMIIFDEVEVSTADYVGKMAAHFNDAVVFFGGTKITDNASVTMTYKAARKI